MVENGKSRGQNPPAAGLILQIVILWGRCCPSPGFLESPGVFTPGNRNGPYAAAGGLSEKRHEKTGERSPVLCIPGGAGGVARPVLILARVNVPGHRKRPRAACPRGGGVISNLDCILAFLLSTGTAGAARPGIIPGFRIPCNHPFLDPPL